MVQQQLSRNGILCLATLNNEPFPVSRRYCNTINVIALGISLPGRYSMAF